MSIIIGSALTGIVEIVDNENKNYIVSRLIGPIFLACAIVFYLAPALVQIPLTTGVQVSDEALSLSPLRHPVGNPPIVLINGYQRDCLDCHMLFQSPKNITIAAGQHDNIIMDHGMNAECVNCHDIENRNLLVLRFGKTVTFDNVDQLCAKCHGPTFRDWQKGTHGKTLGYWDPAMGPSRKLTCTECHDPHAPAFGTLKPLAQPETLRMGDQTDHSKSDRSKDRRNPLRTWSNVTQLDDPSEHKKTLPENQERP